MSENETRRGEEIAVAVAGLLVWIAAVTVFADRTVEDLKAPRYDPSALIRSVRDFERCLLRSGYVWPGTDSRFDLDTKDEGGKVKADAEAGEAFDNSEQYSVACLG